MSILIDRDTRLLIQGITGGEGSFHTQRLLEYGTRVVAGVTPGKGGGEVQGVPVFNTVDQAVRESGANASIIFVPAPFAADAILEAADANLPLIVCITEGIPAADMITVRSYLQGRETRVIGPNCPGVISPGQSKVGIMPHDVFSPGPVAILSRSGTLTYEAAAQLTRRGIGQSTCIGLGGDPILGTTFAEALALLEQDAATEAVVLIGEIGGSYEQEAAEFIKRDMAKPVVAFVAGSTAPPGKRMGHAGAIIIGSAGRAQEKIKALSAAGVTIVPNPAEIGAVTEKVLASRRA